MSCKVRAGTGTKSIRSPATRLEARIGHNLFPTFITDNKSYACFYLIRGKFHIKRATYMHTSM